MSDITRGNTSENRSAVLRSQTFSIGDSKLVVTEEPEEEKPKRKSPRKSPRGGVFASSSSLSNLLGPSSASDPPSSSLSPNKSPIIVSPSCSNQSSPISLLVTPPTKTRSPGSSPFSPSLLPAPKSPGGLSPLSISQRKGTLSPPSSPKDSDARPPRRLSLVVTPLTHPRATPPSSSSSPSPLLPAPKMSLSPPHSPSQSDARPPPKVSICVTPPTRHRDPPSSPSSSPHGLSPPPSPSYSDARPPKKISMVVT
eukprot:CAMPEP_0201513358 /NCGR_PEP_ID=MMETSP0161_2-20130828/5425_1 /ASSEMBLY_ACC=CAM_ASM_000251 /TAXON_ID=180227 /ORGANISM="Neoparamoeba aestuarina, Strain SoJaBio B1-5/56/2" /LENGTH=253 /DNA_ID=CAMNT_0047909531 /DNA_START=197 /DNA_END=954 /DNA_ORIENTATION=+